MRKKNFRLALTGIALLIFAGAQAQTYSETALLFSRTQPAGSARILGMGGSQTALGGDFSAALSNPAGLGMFNRSEFSFSLGLADHQTSANYLGRYTDEGKSVFNIPALSYVWNIPHRNGGDFYGGSLGISFSRTNDFNRAVTYQGDNADNSLIDYFIEQAFGETTDQFFESDYANYNTPTALAYFNYLIGPRSILDPPGAEDEYFTDAGYPFQREDIRVNGASNQWSISYGGNVKDMFFFGGGIGITSLRYESQKIFAETFPANEPLQGFELVENLSIRGTGINATLGAIVRPVNFLQIGVSYTSPTFFGMTETYDASMSSRWDNFDYYGDGETILGDNSANPEETEIITSDYNFTAPMRLRGGLAFISQHGLITADVEMVNPSRAKYRARDDFDFISFEGDNADIRSIYKPAVNYRIGGEYRLNIFRFRAGYGIQTNSYSDSMEADNTVTSLSGGAGVRTKSFYIDLAVIHRAGKDYRYQPYTFLDGSGPVAELKDKSLMGIITVGFNF